ncbi:MAG: cation-translocating P-type ATPase [Promethearchaeota archaeon]|nr:MAG: cation-translocating P-type ATPase [Candidatus Lokiarchaeota archaeon]
MTIECTSAVCKIDEEEIEEESLFEENFWRFIIPSALLLALSIFLEFFTEEVFLSQILAIISISLSSYDVVKEAIENVIDKKITANVLMVVAAIASFFILHGQEGATAILLYAIAEHLEEVTTERSRNAIKELLELAPDEALLKVNDSYKNVNTHEIVVGDIIGIKPGMKAPLDGIIVAGQSYFDESAITGESIPVYKEEGDEVFAASINSDSFIDLKVTRESSNTIVAQIAESIKEAQKNKSDGEKFIERFAKYYTPIILIVSILVMTIPTLLFGLDFNDWFYRGLVLLVVSCPCALTLSTPLANITALTKLAKEGILVKGNKYIEKVNKIEAFAFDKTGTLTEGNLKVFDVVSFGIEKENVLSIAASLELLSEHLIGKAIVKQVSEMDIKTYPVENFEIIRGKGIKGEIDGKRYFVGSTKFFKDLKIDLPHDQLELIEIAGTIPILLGTEREILGIISIRDVLRISAPILVDGLKKRGYKVALISGDNQKVCNEISACLDIDNTKGELLPNQKIEEINQLKTKYHTVAMVGDGINDAPSLAVADLGIAIGASATDLTLETADVIIMNDDLKKLLTFIDVSKNTNTIIRQNIWTSIIVKVSFAVLTVIGLMSLWLAVGIGDMGVSLLVLINGLRILRYKNKFKEINAEKVESKAKMLICENCNTKRLIPQHHGRDMLKSEDKLICWRKMLNSEELEPCEEELPLFCPNCEKKLELV